MKSATVSAVSPWFPRCSCTQISQLNDSQPMKSATVSAVSPWFPRCSCTQISQLNDSQSVKSMGDRQPVKSTTVSAVMSWFPRCSCTQMTVSLWNLRQIIKGQLVQGQGLLLKGDNSYKCAIHKTRSEKQNRESAKVNWTRKVKVIQ